MGHAIVFGAVIAITRRARLHVGGAYCRPLYAARTGVRILPVDVKGVTIGRGVCVNSICGYSAVVQDDAAFVHIGRRGKGFGVDVVVGLADAYSIFPASIKAREREAAVGKGGGFRMSVSRSSHYGPCQWIALVARCHAAVGVSLQFCQLDIEGSACLFNSNLLVVISKSFGRNRDILRPRRNIVEAVAAVFGGGCGEFIVGEGHEGTGNRVSLPIFYLAVE